MNRIDIDQVLQFFKTSGWKPFDLGFIDYYNKKACIFGAILIMRGLDQSLNKNQFESNWVSGKEAQDKAIEIFKSKGYVLGIQAGFNPPGNKNRSLDWQTAKDTMLDAIANGIPKLTSKTLKLFWGATDEDFKIGFEDARKIADLVDWS